MALRSDSLPPARHFAVLLLLSGQPFSADVNLPPAAPGVQRNGAVVADKPLFFRILQRGGKFLQPPQCLLWRVAVNYKPFLIDALSGQGGNGFLSGPEYAAVAPANCEISSSTRSIDIPASENSASATGRPSDSFFITPPRSQPAQHQRHRRNRTHRRSHGTATDARTGRSDRRRSTRRRQKSPSGEMPGEGGEHHNQMHAATVVSSASSRGIAHFRRALPRRNVDAVHHPLGEGNRACSQRKCR